MRPMSRAKRRLNTRVAAAVDRLAALLLPLVFEQRRELQRVETSHSPPCVQLPALLARSVSCTIVRMVGSTIADAVRVRAERPLAALLMKAPVDASPFDDEREPVKTHARVRSTAVQLVPEKAPTIFAALAQAQAAVGHSGPTEIFVAEEFLDGHGQATQACVTAPLPDDPITVISYWPRTLKLRSRAEHAYVLGHELAHVVAGHLGEHTGYTRAWRAMRSRREEIRDLAFRVRLACEMTADRLGLIACRDLHAAVRVEMWAATGVDPSELPVTTEDFLEQARRVVEDGPDAALVGSTHPAAAVRCHALALFARSPQYARITGTGAADLSDDAMEEVIASMLDRFDTHDSRRILDAAAEALGAPPFRPPRAKGTGAKSLGSAVLKAVDALDERLQPRPGGILDRAEVALERTSKKLDERLGVAAEGIIDLPERLRPPVGGVLDRVEEALGHAGETLDTRVETAVYGVLDLAARAFDSARGRSPRADGHEAEARDRRERDPYEEDLLRRFEQLERRLEKRREPRDD